MFKKIQNFLTQKNKFETRLNLPIILVIICIDIFLIVNIFAGLGNVSNLNGSQSAIYPCQYQLETLASKSVPDSQKIAILRYDQNNYYQLGTGLFSKDAFCDQIDSKLRTIRQDQQLTNLYLDLDSFSQEINNNQTKISNLEAQYNSTLLEKIADQDPSKSINQSNSNATKRDIEIAKQENLQLEKRIKIDTESIIANSKIQYFLKISNNTDYLAFTKRLQNYIFWQPVVAFALKALYLIPIILLSFLVNWFATKKNWQILAVISWNIFLLSFIPIVLQVFDFLQIGFLFSFLGNLILSVSENLLFLLSYFYIFLIPLIGYLFIVFLQKVVFNQKATQIKRIQNNCCIKCSFKMKDGDIFCSNCGTAQTYKCSNCSSDCPKGLNYCPKCGSKNTNF